MSVEIKLSKAKPKGSGKSYKWRQSVHHKETRKYEKQRARTEKNKAKHIVKSKVLHEKAAKKCLYCDGWGTHGDDVNRGETCKACGGTGVSREIIS